MQIEFQQGEGKPTKVDKKQYVNYRGISLLNIDIQS